MPESTDQNTATEAPSTPQTSPARIAANRANALLSTGPTSAEGKSRSAQNALVHGLRRRLDPAALVPQLEQSDYLNFLQDFRENLRPQSPIEDLLVERVALLGWKLRRHAQAEAVLLDLANHREHRKVEAANQKALTQHEEILAYNKLYSIKKSPAPPVPQPTPAPKPAAELLARFAENTAANPLQTLQRYETATERAFYKALTQYRALHVPQEAAPTPLHHHFHYHRHETPPPLQNYDKFPNEANAMSQTPSTCHPQLPVGNSTSNEYDNPTVLIPEAIKPAPERT